MREESRPATLKDLTCLSILSPFKFLNEHATAQVCVCVCVYAYALQGCARLINYPLLLGRGGEEIDEALLPIEPTEL